ncbi:MAG: alpha-1,2-fucosyltransferase [Candidatus Atribacteria bacterium]|nr:alpha-1,2-fucosyltransferase [Candidatus Atribacteria bacterium]
MKIIKIFGGLGNQMFQFAFSLKLNQLGFKICHDDSWFSHYYAHTNIKIDTVFNLTFNRPSTFVSLLLNINQNQFFGKGLKKALRLLGKYYTDGDNFNFRNFKPDSTIVFDGYWQDLNYIPFEPSLLKEKFEFKETLFSHEDFSLRTQIENTCSVSLHVRRNDYLSKTNASIFGNICTADYYNNSIHKIQEFLHSPVFYIFSDDIQWCRKNFCFLKQCHFVDQNIAGNNFKDMWLMKHCKHNIIANSSFSWWGAFLNQNEEKIVIAPKKWKNINDRNNIIPSAWIRI